MFLIIGLGNPGSRYDGTRHNMGYDVITELIDRYDVPSDGTAMNALYGKGRIEGESVILVKPLTYMNCSGQAVQQYVQYYKVDPASELLVIYDDIDLAPGQIRIREQGSAGSHNGMKDIVQKLGTDRFARIRVGIGARPENWDLADYVLARPSAEERALLDEAIQDAARAAAQIIRGDIEGAMSLYNRKQA